MGALTLIRHNAHRVDVDGHAMLMHVPTTSLFELDGVARDVYDLFVTPDGCYAATAEGESLGAPTITAPDGRRVRNLLYAFEGCFDKGSAAAVRS